MASEAQRRASARYQKINVKSYTIAFYPKDKEIHEWLCQQESKAKYIRELIRKDMEAHMNNNPQE